MRNAVKREMRFSIAAVSAGSAGSGSGRNSAGSAGGARPTDSNGGGWRGARLAQRAAGRRRRSCRHPCPALS